MTVSIEDLDTVPLVRATANIVVRVCCTTGKKICGRLTR